MYYYKILDETSDSSDSSKNYSEMLPTKEFVITFSSDEWQMIQPEAVCYKDNNNTRAAKNLRVYYVLPKNMWTPIIFFIFGSIHI